MSPLMAIAVPERSPPPPQGAITASSGPGLFEQFEGGGTLAGDDVPVVEGVDQSVAVTLDQVRRPSIPGIRGSARRGRPGRH